MYVAFKVAKPSNLPIVQEGTQLYYAHCVYQKALAQGLIPGLHRNYVEAHYEYFYDVQYAAACLKVLRWNKRRVQAAGLWRDELA